MEQFLFHGHRQSNRQCLRGQCFHLNSNSVWTAAAPTSGNNFSNWTASVTLTPGTNTIQAYSVDSSGNVSPTNKITFVYILSAVLTVNEIGEGRISTNYNGQLLPIGRNFQMTATATNGFQFTGWTGSSTTNSPTLIFTMASNLVFTANFADTNSLYRQHHPADPESAMEQFAFHGHRQKQPTMPPWPMFSTPQQHPVWTAAAPASGNNFSN